VVKVDLDEADSRGLVLPPRERTALWDALLEAVESCRARVDAGSVARRFDPEAIRALLASLDFQRPADPAELARFVAAEPERHQSFAVAGRDGHDEALGHQASMGDRLRQRLTEDGWSVVNETPRPVVCFVDSTHPAGGSADYLEAIGRDVVVGGRARVSTAVLGGTTPVLRACVTDVRTSEDDLDVLVETLDVSRHRIGVVWPASTPAPCRRAARLAEVSGHADAGAEERVAVAT
jgi:hypothetical protein